MKEIKKEFSVARTPQQNGVVEIKNKTLIEATRTMLADSLLPILFWADAVNTVCHVENRILVTKPHNKTPYELLLGRTPSIGFMRPFGCTITIPNTQDPLGKFNGKDDEGFLVGYSVISKAFRVFCSRIRIVQETLNINFLKNQPNVTGSGPKWLFDIDTLTQSMNYQPVVAENQPNPSACIQDDAGKVGKKTNSTQQYMLLPFWSTGSKDPRNIDVDAAFDVKENENEVHVSPKDVGAEADFSYLETSITVSPISTTRVYKDHPVTQIFGRIKAIRLFLAYASFMGFMVYQMDVKSAFLYETIEEEVYVCQPPGFEDPNYPDKVYKLVKALYGLHQAPRAWYETLANYLLENGFQTGKIDQTLFIKKQKAFEKLMKDKFQMSSMGEITFFLRLQVKQKDDGIFISQDKYVAKLLKKFGLTDGKSASTPIDNEKPLLKDPDGEDVNVHIYRSMIGSLMYLTSSRPDIMFAVCACAYFQVTPKVSHCM
nr:retrovirus-related Pol polyprotein from transposon TNT 1-94 [Tanacetum cinerariifolium]